MINKRKKWCSAVTALMMTMTLWPVAPTYAETNESAATETAVTTAETTTTEPATTPASETTAPATYATISDARSEANGTIHFTLSEPGFIQLEIYDGESNKIRTLIDHQQLAAGANQATWDGKDQAGVVQPAAGYTFRIFVLNAEGATQNEASGTVTLSDSEPVNRELLSEVGVTNQEDTAVIAYILSEPATITTEIYNADNQLVRTLSDAVSKEAGSYSNEWDLRDNNGSVVQNGVYTYKITAVTGESRTGEATGSIDLVKQMPEIHDLTVRPGYVDLDKGIPAKLSYRVLKSGTTSVFIEGVGKALVTDRQVTKGELVEIEWDGKDASGQVLPSGSYSFTVTTTDRIGQQAEKTTSVFVGYREGAFLNFTEHPDPLRVSDKTKSTIEFDLAYAGLVTVELFDSQDRLVRTLLRDAVYSMPSHVSVDWDGKNDAGEWVADGTYIYRVSGTDLAGVPLRSSAPGAITTDKTAPEISNLISTPTPYSPKHDPNVLIEYVLSEDANVTLGVYNSAGVLIKTLLTEAGKKAGLNSIAWDGKNSAGVVVPDGTYSYKITATDKVGWNSNASGAIKVATGVPPVISNVSETFDPFKLTGTNATTIYYTLSAPANVTLKIYDSRFNLVRTLIDNAPTTAGAKPVAWDGRNDAGALVEDGTYTYKINAINSVGRSAPEVTGTITTDKTAPNVTGLVATPAPFAPLGSNSLYIKYELSEDAKVTLGIYNSANVLVKTLLTTAVNRAGTNITEWDGKDSAGNIVPVGAYSYKILATDKVGFSRSVSGVFRVEKPLFISGVSDTADPFKVTGTTASTIYYSLSEQATVNLKIYDSSNRLVRTLVDNITVPAGQKAVAWNGANDAGMLVEDGVYTYKINAVSVTTGVAAPEATGTITTDKTAPYITNIKGLPNPFNPTISRMSILYDLNEAADVTVRIYDTSNVLIRTITAPVTNKAGTNRIVWDGKDSAGLIVPDGSYSYRILAVDKVGLGRYGYGVVKVSSLARYTPPVISKLSYRPDPFKVSETTAATMYYTLNKPAYVTFRIYDSNNRPVRTLINNVYTTAGTKPVAWYGNDETGALVEDGVYTYRVEALDTSGILSLEAVGYIKTDKNAPVITNVTATPNPFNPSSGVLTIGYELNEESNVKFDIYNSSNVLVKTITAVANQAGVNSVTWDGTDNTGVIVPNGAYNYRMLATDKVGLGRSISGVVKVENVPVAPAPVSTP